MNWIALGFSLLAFQGLAQAQWADQDGFVDYGMTHQVIINGDEVPSAEAMIYYGTARIVSDMGDVLKNCSGTVIAPNVILTAAHCLMLRPQPANMKVRIAGKDHAVSSYVSHEGFVYTPPNEDHGAKTENDIALIFLRKNLPSRSVPALLPPQGWRIDVAVDGILAGY
ncbi:MAG TPA: trypsin-like serine protease, partial [Pseudobdellovibrionaceae bacterium]|nr:trypsin-like serine protease [Pseudobdellovibrionaceae bacterium]